MAAQGTHPIPSHHYTATDPLFSSHISNNVYYSPQEGNRPPESESNIASEQYQMEGELQFDTEDPSDFLNWECLDLDILNDPSLSMDLKPASYGSTNTCSGPPTSSYSHQNRASFGSPPVYQGASNGEQMRFFEQQQAKLRQTQQLQQQKLLELQQTILQAQLLKTKLSLASMTSSNTDHVPPVVTQATSSVSTTTSTTNSSVTVPSGLGDIPGLKLPLQRATSRMPFGPERKTAHNAIERKYRLSINDRINDLRQIVTGGDDEQGKKLQKAAVLRKTIDYIRHLENTNRKLCEENRKLREVVTGSTDHIPITSGNSPMMSSTSSNVSSPLSSNSSNPHSPVHMTTVPPYSNHHSSHSESKLPTFLTSLLTMGDGPRVIMCVLMMFTLVLMPTSVFTTGGGSKDYSESHGPGRHLFSYDNTPAVSSILLLLSLVCRVSLAWLCLGWFVSHSVPGALGMASRQYTSFWKHSREGSAMKYKGKYREAVVQYYNALAAVGVTMATSSFTTVLSLLWQAICFVYIHMLGGRFMVRLVRQKGWLKEKSGVTPMNVAQVLHECHEAAMLVETHSVFKRWQLALAAVNVAHVYGKVPGEFWMSGVLESFLSLPPFLVGVATKYNMYKARYSEGLPLHLRWMQEQKGYDLLCSEEDIWDPRARAAGPHGSPLLRATYLYLKQCLSESFQQLLYPDKDKANSKSFSDIQETFRSILDTSKSVSSTTDDLTPDTGFEDITWWAAIGVVASKWLSDANDDDISDVYHIVESIPHTLTHNSDPLSSALLFAFRGHMLYRKENEEVTKVLHLLHSASMALSSSVALPMDECSQTSDTLWQLGQILACDLLFAIRLAIWEEHKSNDVVRTAVCRGYYSDVDSLSQITATSTAPMPRLLLHKACLSVMNGSNPLETQRLLAGVRSWRKTHRQEDGSGGHSYEEALATVLVFKHLPGGPHSQEQGSVLQEAARVFRKFGDQMGMRRCYSLAAQ